jgi:Transglutaminase-like superfamily
MYYFSNGVSGCETSEGAIFLDFRTGKYLGVTESNMDVFRLYVNGWPAPAGLRPDPVGAASDTNMSVLGELCSKGLLSKTPPENSDAKIQDLPAATETLSLQVNDISSIIFRLWLDVTLVLSIIYVWINLKFNRLDAVIRRIRSLKEAATRDELEPDPTRLRTIVSHFRRASLWLYSRDGKCLFDSLVLTRFLYWHGVAPLLVFGVRTKPFSAHAWVQVSHSMLTDSVELGLNTTPIFIT